MTKTLVVIGATGDVGSGITKTLLRHGHRVIAAARTAERLAALRESCAHPAHLHAVAGSLESDASAAALLASIRAAVDGVAVAGIDAVIVSVNAPRAPAALVQRPSEDLATLLRADLVSHYTAARTFVPALAPGGVLLGIGGGSCDFILHEGVPQSVAQAGLRMLYRGLAHELAGRPLHVRQLIIASIVNGASTRERADPLWVTDEEIGEQVAAIVEAPEAHPGPILRLARRDGTGRPVFTTEAPTRIQGLR